MVNGGCQSFVSQEDDYVGPRAQIFSYKMNEFWGS